MTHEEIGKRVDFAMPNGKQVMLRGVRLWTEERSDALDKQLREEWNRKLKGG